MLHMFNTWILGMYQPPNEPPTHVYVLGIHHPDDPNREATATIIPAFDPDVSRLCITSAPLSKVHLDGHKVAEIYQAQQLDIKSKLKAEKKKASKKK